MKAAIVGKSQVNEVLIRHLEAENIEPILLEDVDSIKRFTGEKGNFTIENKDGQLGADYVIITQEAEKKNLLKKVPSPISLESVDEIAQLRNSGGPVVFLMDYNCESPSFLTKIALEKAIKLAQNKEKVIYLARFIRTSGDELEIMYKKARNAGVSFIKYNEVSMEYDENQEIYHIEVSEDYDNLNIDSSVVISGDGLISGDKISKIAKLFNIKTDDEGYLKGDKHFLYPIYTSRKGIFVIGTASGSMEQEELSTLIFYILSEMKKDWEENPDNSFPQIDEGKCAFCYTCFRACPHSALTPDYDNSVMKVFENACYSCGICAAVCPANAIELGDTVNVSQQDETHKEKLIVFCCENSAEIAVKRLKEEMGADFEKIQVASLDCGGKVSSSQVLEALNKYEKIVVATCMDNACKHFEGSKRALMQVMKVKGLLKQLGLDESRVEMVKISHAMPYVILDYLNEVLTGK